MSTVPLRMAQPADTSPPPSVFPRLSILRFFGTAARRFAYVPNYTNYMPSKGDTALVARVVRVYYDNSVQCWPLAFTGIVGEQDSDY